MKNISVRCPADLHKKVKLKMLEDTGEDNFTQLIVGLLAEYANGQHKPAPQPLLQKETTQFERCLAANPDVTRAYLSSLQAAIETLGGIPLNVQSSTVAIDKHSRKGKL